MNTKLSLLVLGVTVLIVSQVAGEDSTISGFTSAGADNFQPSVEDRAEASGLSSSPAPKVKQVPQIPMQSMEDFYGADEETSSNMINPDADFDNEPVTSDAEPSSAPVGNKAPVTSGVGLPQDLGGL